MAALVLAATVVIGLLAPARADTPPPANPATIITFLVGLPVRDGAVDTFAKAVSTPGSARFRQLTAYVTR